MVALHAFEAPDRFRAGTLGEGDARCWCVQVREGETLVTATISHENLGALRDTLSQVLTEHGSALLEQAEPDLVAPLDAPVEPAFDVAALAVFDDAYAGVLIVLASDARLFGEPEPGQDPTFADLLGATLDDDTTPGAAITVRLDVAQVVEFVRHTGAVLADGRPACPLCAQPVDSAGHVCPRRNGYRGPDAWPTSRTRL